MSERRDWDRRAREAAALRKLTPDDVRALFAAAFAPGGAARRPLLVVADKGRPAGGLAADIPDAPAFAAGLEAW